MTQLYNLPHDTPESQGVSSQTVLALLDSLEKNIHEMHSIMILRHGVVIAEGWWSPYSSFMPHTLFSLTKSFTSTAVGMAVSEGLVSIDDQVVSFFSKEALVNPGKNLAAMQVKHLLSMSTGHAVDTTSSLVANPDKSDWVKKFLELPVEFEPGTHFLYNSGASYILSAIVQKMSGLKLEDYLKRRLFAPLGIEQVNWETSPQDINIGGWGLTITTEDIARFGQLYLQKGVWGGLQLVPKNWVEAATSKQVSNGSNPDSDWEQGYGYQFWRCRHNCYRGDGAFGQFCVVMPDQDAVLAITAGMDEMQPVLNLVWEHLLPGFEPAPLPEDQGSQKSLATKLINLNLPIPAGLHTSGLILKLSRNPFQFEANDQKFQTVEYIFTPEGCSAIFKDERGEHSIDCAYEEWLPGSTTFFNRQLLVLASCVWQDEATFVMTLRFINTPIYLTITNKFESEQVKVHVLASVSFESKEYNLIGIRSGNLGF